MKISTNDCGVGKSEVVTARHLSSVMRYWVTAEVMKGLRRKVREAAANIIDTIPDLDGMVYDAVHEEVECLVPHKVDNSVLVESAKATKANEFRGYNVACGNKPEDRCGFTMNDVIVDGLPNIMAQASNGIDHDIF